jgi:hypothetical protein
VRFQAAGDGQAGPGRKVRVVIPRLLAASAALLGTLCAAGLAVAVAGAGLGTYVSEAGVPGTAHADLYRAAVIGVGVTAALLAAALRGGAAYAALALAVAAPFVAVSGSVTCTPGCPLPPYESTTPADLFHAGASMVGVGGCALAMFALAAVAAGRLRRVSRIAVAVAWPVLAATAVSIVAAGRGAVTGALERLALGLCVIWLVAVGVLRAAES